MAHNKPLADGIGAPDEAKGPGKWVGKDDYKKRKELDEARKAGNAPAEVDIVTGRDINPHIPQYIMKTPWFYQQDGVTITHQHNLKPVVHVDGVNTAYNRGFTGRATQYREGACQNCGAMTHSKKDCFYRPRKQGAARTNADIMPDEVVPQSLALDYDGKRDRWAGYNPAQYTAVVDEYEKLEELRRQAKAAQLVAERIAKGDEAEAAAAAAALEVNNAVAAEEFAEDGEAEMIGQHFDAKTRMTVRNLRIREDTAKYLYNLDPNSAHYDPKSRSMRADPLPHVPMEEKPFAGDNFVRGGGETRTFNEVRKFAWEAQEMGMDVDEVGAPSAAIRKFHEYQEKKKEADSSKSRTIAQQYGGADALAAPVPMDILMGASEVYREYAPDGTLLKGPAPVVPVSRYPENVLIGNHTAVWGSFWRDFKWGYACCHQFVKNCVCTGEAGRRLASSGALVAPIVAAGREPAPAPPAQAADGKKEKKKKDKKKDKKGGKKKEKKEKKKRERSAAEVTPADMEQYRRTKMALGDPMNDRT